MRSLTLCTALVLALLAGSMTGRAGQLGTRPFTGSLDHPAIEYATRPLRDPVAELNRGIEHGQVRLAADDSSGYLRAVLDALDVPVASQMLVFSKTGIQAAITGPGNPRALFFNDSVVVGYIRGAPMLELAAHDPSQGMVFYTFDQHPSGRGRASFTRRDLCLRCHLSFNSLDVPGLLARSVFTAPDGRAMFQLGSFLIDHRSPLSERWGGWYVTGTHGAMRHMGNATVTNAADPESMITDATLNRRSLDNTFDTRGYPSPSSDIAALMIFEHQARMMNLLTRLGWDVRVAAYEGRLDFLGGPLRDAIEELVDYLLFVDEEPLTAKIQGTSGFAEAFSTLGPRDRRGRSLRQLDLTTRLLRYPCSYTIYSAAFDALPGDAREAIYRRVWEILWGRGDRPAYARLSRADRLAIVEILRETKSDLPAYFSGAAAR